MREIRLSDRLCKLNKRLQEVDYHNARPWYFEDVNILDIPENEYLKSEPIVIRKAYAIKYVAEHMPVIIYDDELIVGYNAQNSVEFGLSVPKYLTTEERKFMSSYGLSEVSLSGHHPPEWGRIIRYGTQGLRGEVTQYLNRELEQQILDHEKINTYRAMLISLEALELFANRYSQQLQAKASVENSEERKEELLKMSVCLEQIPKHPASTLWEAVQSYWITYTLLNSCGEMLPLGRIDQYFYPYYEHDMREGFIDEEMARDIIGSFLIKCNEKNVLDATIFTDHMSLGAMYCGILYMPQTVIEANEKCREMHRWHPELPEDSEENKFFGQEANNRMMTAVVGGRLPDGSDGTNALSYMFIELVKKMELLMPTLGARIHKETPEDFIRLLAEVLQHGQGEPIIYNDEAILRGYETLDIPMCDAKDYSSDGCWETLIPGKTNFAYGLINVLQALEYTMNNGKNVKTGIAESFESGKLSSFQTFEQFYNAYISQIKFMMDESAGWFVETQGTPAIVAPDPLFSVLGEDCIQKGKDFYDTGARYIIRMMLLTGFADAIDSLAVIKRVVYEEKKVTLEELNDALHKNWEGNERLRAYVINRVDKYGNDKDDVDAIGVKLVADFSENIRKLRNKYKNIIWTGGIGTFHMYAKWGEHVSATPNGRYSYDALAPNYSPVPGCDSNGPLSVLKSASKADLRDMMTGTPVDISINANEFQGESGILRLMDMIKGFCDLDGQIMSITSTSVEELKKAKLYPEKYGTLRVRMGGLSAYFVQLAPVAQDKIIERFERM